MIPFNKPYLSGSEIKYIEEAVNSGKISGNGMFTKKCQAFFQQRYHFKKCLLTNSCTDALEMAAMLCDIKQGDEVIIPSYTFVSTANAFVIRGAKIIFADSRKDHPGIDEYKLESLITPRTKIIVPVHYAGIACDMNVIMDIAARYGLYVVEDAAHAIGSEYKGQKIGNCKYSDMTIFSFHPVKAIAAGEGGMITTNDENLYRKMILYRSHGITKREDMLTENHGGWYYEMHELSHNYRLTDFQSALGNSQLKRADQNLKKRQ